MAFERMRRRKTCGFTLAEVLVAVSILGLLGVVSWRGLNHVMNQRAWIVEQNQEVDRVVRVFAQIERDIGQHVADVLMSGSLSALPLLPRSLAIATNARGSVTITILRRHPAGIGVENVVYRVRDSRLERMAGSDANARRGVVTMLTDVSGMETRVLDQEGWADEASQARSRVKAMEITIVRASGERYVRVLPL